jgi:hypothetical protein
VAGGVNDINALRLVFEQFENAFFFALIPKTGRRGRGDRNAALSFLLIQSVTVLPSSTSPIR